MAIKNITQQESQFPKIYLQDINTFIEKDISNNLTFTDIVSGTKTLAELNTTLFEDLLFNIYNVAAGFNMSFDASGLTADRIYSAPDSNGYLALTDVNGNFFIGAERGIYKTITNDNWFMAGSGVNLPTGTAQSNLIIGLNAATAINNGSLNIALGRGTLGSLNNGNSNIALGDTTGNNIENGTGNILIGRNTGFNIIDSSYTTAIGHQAGYNVDADGGIYIGYEAGYYETGTNKLFISSIAALSQVDESTARTKAIIYGEQSTTTASQLLRVNGNLGVNVDPSGTFHSHGVSAGWSILTTSESFSNQSGIYFTSGGDSQIIGRDGTGVIRSYFNSDGDSWITGGNLGIGTTSPSVLIDIFISTSGATASTDAALNIESSDSAWIQFLGGTTSSQGILWGDSGDSDIGRFIYNHNNDRFEFWVNGNIEAYLTDIGLILGTGEGGSTIATGNIIRSPDITTGGAGNIDGTDLTVQSGIGTGTGDTGSIIFNTVSETTSGDNLQSISTNTMVLKDGNTNIREEVFSAKIVTTTLTGATDNWSPSGLQTSGRIVASATGNIDLTGLDSTNILDGEIRIFENTNSSSGDIKLKNNSASSLAANRFYLSGDITVKVNQATKLMYSSNVGTSGGWIILGTLG